MRRWGNRRAWWVGWLFALLAILAPAAVRAETEVDLALVLAVDKTDANVVSSYSFVPVADRTCPVL